MTTGAPARPVLRVYVTPGCAGCRRALEVAAAVRRARPAQVVEVIDLADRPGEPLPPGVVGTPTYLLGGRLVSMGNPELDELLRDLDAASTTVDDG